MKQQLGKYWEIAVVIFTALILQSLAVCAVAETRDSLLERGDAADRALKTEEALHVFLEAEKIAPNDAEVLRRIAKQYAESMTDTKSEDAQKELGKKALDYAQRAVAADENNALAQLALAICYGRLAPLVESKTKISYSKLVKEHAERSLALDAKNDYAYHVLGAWNYEVAGLSSFMRTLAKLVYGEIPPASYDDAVKFFLKAIELQPKRVSHHIELGRTYVALGKKDLARAELERGLSLPSREKDDPDSKERGRAALQKLR